jgi:8-oxo-dGTP diphosphatase
MVTVDAAVFFFCSDRLRRTVKLLLINRGSEPYKGMWALPGGFVDMDEELEDAAVRELAEETGIRNVRLEQMHTFGRCGRDPRGRQISIVFVGVVPGRTVRPPRPKAGDDAAKARWFDLERLPPNLAFDHSEVVDMAVGKLKKTAAYRRHVRPGRRG